MCGVNLNRWHLRDKTLNILYLMIYARLKACSTWREAEVNYACCLIWDCYFIGERCVIFWVQKCDVIRDCKRDGGKPEVSCVCLRSLRLMRDLLLFHGCREVDDVFHSGSGC
jgi:hypothetical protein